MAPVYDNAIVFYFPEGKEKVYDGTPLTYSDDEIMIEGELPAGFTYTATDTGSQTEIGTSTSGVRYRVYDADGYDVTDCFTNVTVTEGYLTVHGA